MNEERTRYTVEYHTITERNVVRHRKITVMAYDDIEAWSSAEALIASHTDYHFAIDDVSAES